MEWTTEAAASDAPAAENGFTDATQNGFGKGNENEVTNGETEPPQAEPKLTKEEYLQKARDKGWNETTAFDYDEFQRTGGNDGEWLGAAKVYEWKDEYGDVGPEVPELERILFGGEFQMRKGDSMSNLTEIEVALEGPEKLSSFKKASQMNVDQAALLLT